ncbi:MAG: DUF885 domain-containing protein [Reichenbachiella sp.]|uniref:DUF885 domain-containing protein n=1 Tax=Reichenbachiella sp. TaxID=2184521 RepID=UPI003267A1DE
MRLIIIGFFAFFYIFSCSTKNEERTLPSGQKWDVLVNNFIEEYFVLEPTVAIHAGRHEFDGQLPDFSYEGISGKIMMLKKYRSEVQFFESADLDSIRLFEKKHLLSIIQSQLFWLEQARWPYRNFRYYRSILSPEIYVSKNYAPLDKRLVAFINYLERFPVAVNQIRENMSAYPLGEVQIDLGRGFFGGLADYFESEVPLIFQVVSNEALKIKYEQANREAINAARDLTKWLDEQIKTESEFAMGKQMFEDMLRQTEQLNVNVEQLKQLGEEDLHRNLEALRQTCQSFSFGLSISECIQKVKDEKPKEGSIQAASENLKRLKNFIIKNEIISIRSEQECLVVEAPPYRRTNGAYISIPGPYEPDSVRAMFYLSPANENWSEEEITKYTRSKNSVINTAVHEVWPGHFLQRMHAKYNCSSKLGQLFKSRVFSEGWAHYAEEMMLEAGFKSDDEAYRITQILGSLTRNVRFLSAIGLHTSDMTVEQSEEMFREKAFLSPGSARQQAARGVYDPGYFNYTLGKLMIREMKRKGIKNGKSLKEFHDELLSFGMPPIPLIYEQIFGEKFIFESNSKIQMNQYTQSSNN